jgi:histidinol-phosphate aminotransferase
MQNVERVCRPCVLKLEDCDVGMTIEEVQRELGLVDVTKLSENENPFGLSPRAIEAMAAELPNVFMYPEHAFYDLVNAFAAANGVPASMVVAGHGVEALVQLLPQLFVNPGDEVIMADITYGLYRQASILMDANLVTVPLRDFRHDLEAMAKAVTPRTKLIWVCNPNNPTGTIVYRRETRAFLDALPSGVAVVFDQAYGEFVDDPDWADGIEFLKEGYENVVVLRTFSKAHGMAGLRAGYCVASSDVCRFLNRIREPFNVNRLAIVACQASLADHDFLARCLENNKLGRSYLMEQFRRLDMEPVASQANFVLVDTKRDADALFERLLTRGVVVRSASAWGLDTFVRVTVGRPEQNELAVHLLEEESRAMSLPA